MATYCLSPSPNFTLSYITLFPCQFEEGEAYVGINHFLWTFLALKGLTISIFKYLA